MKKLILSVLGVQLFSQPNDRGNVAIILTKPTKDNPSKNGVHEINEGQLRRIITRCLGVYNPIGFKHIIATANGAAKLTIDALECKEGEVFTKANGETGTYTKDWTKYSNHEVDLGVVASMKLAEMSLSASFQQAAEQNSYVAPKKALVAVEATEESDDAKGNVTV